MGVTFIIHKEYRRAAAAAAAAWADF